jgi:hypothetical protein
MLKLLSGIIPCLFISWLYMGDVKTMSEHRGGINNRIHSPVVGDPVGYRLDTWGVGVGFHAAYYHTLKSMNTQAHFEVGWAFLILLRKEVIMHR